MAEDSTAAGGFIWYELMTPDPLAARAFYGAVVGWDIDAQNAMPEGGIDYRMIRRGDGGHAGGVMTLTPEMTGGGAKPGWFGYVHVADVDATIDRFTAAGGGVIMGAQDMEGVGRMALLADPQGAPIYVMTPTPPADQPDAQSDVFDVMKPQHIRWNELTTSDAAGAVAFHTGTFGWKQEGAMPMGEMGDYLFITHGDVGIGAIMPLMPGDTGSAWTFYAGVDDIDRAAQAVRDGGGRLNGEIQEIPGGEFAVHCTDPQGAAFGLVGPRREQG